MFPAATTSCDVTVVNAALMDTPGTGVFIVPPRPPKKPATDRSATVLREPGGSVRIVRLDDFPISYCDLIKLNVEGCEPFVLDGAREILKRFGPVVIMEEAHEKNLPDPYKKSPQRARAILESLGYREVSRSGHDTIWSK